jgi:hypothetical protein
MPKSPDVFYAVLSMCLGGNKYSIFRGRTARSALNRAKERLVDETTFSRAEYEEEHGAVSDDKWLEELDRSGFAIALADLEEY